ncbi:acryloyl-CoA reductase [Paenibacillus alvei]|uniref:acrylyl-CoA reductase family protein n=1 Tax=Paenibacillus alvei TaxID=44250 RepID=UPI0018CEB604|nr:acryloyl-CoA reductase [Paenibacillus alvei]MBG9736381.1 quinone oxidoreductase [Paenibacillus alvei]MBG9742876.1 quinone oxidoreductase [Paenibacillus alvei]MCY9577850.1 acryloyl-CoA reductase [Paenibacillus alvei]MCY9586974.1 acryloyl-CoA reductase [Paenibacillus alvei]
MLQQQQFSALWIQQQSDGALDIQVQPCTTDQLSAGTVTIRTAYSGLNYKDALACSPTGNIVKSYPFIPGIDMSGVVMQSEDERYSPGQRVLVSGYGLGVTHTGGLSEIVRVPAEWIVPLPDSLSLREAMIFGTAGLTAALAVERLERHGITPEQGPILVTGATGGVGSIAVSMLANLGYEVAASTGKAQYEELLYTLGAKHIVARGELLPERPRPLDKQRWAGAIDVCGGAILASVLSSLHYGGAVAAAGMTAGGALPASVFPFILRGATLYGIDSVFVSNEDRMRLWSRIGKQWKSFIDTPNWIRELQLSEVPAYVTELLHGKSHGRAIVKIGDNE